MEIRAFLPGDDRLSVSRVYEESWKYAYRGILPQAYLDSLPAGRWGETVDRRPTLLLLDGEEIAGVSSCCASRFPAWPDWGEVVSLYLLPSRMGRGFGAALLRAAEEHLESMGFRQRFLWVLEENVRARRFYERNGWTCGGETREDVIGGRAVREVRYVRRKNFPDAPPPSGNKPGVRNV